MTCPRCLGNGYICPDDEGSSDCPDTSVHCPACGGTGSKPEIPGQESLL